jgi:hypothetical protein
MGRISGTSSYIYFETDIFPGLAITGENPGPYVTTHGLLADFVMRRDGLGRSCRRQDFPGNSCVMENTRRGSEPQLGPLPRRYLVFCLVESAVALVQSVVNLGQGDQRASIVGRDCIVDGGV